MPCCMHEGDNPAERDAAADRPWRQNLGAAKRLRADWHRARPTRRPPRGCSTSCARAAKAMRRPRSSSCSTAASPPQSIWDALFAGAGELLLRQPGIVALHAVTTTNALHYAFQHSGDDETRRLLLLQNAAFLPMFREAMRGRGKLADRRIDRLATGRCRAATVPTSKPSSPRSASDPLSAAGKMLGYLHAGGDRRRT